MSLSTLKQKPVAGIACMIVGMAFISFMDATAKWLVADFAIIQILAIRGAISLILVTPLLLLSEGSRQLVPKKSLLVQLLRSICGVVALFSFFLALRFMPLADATAIIFSGTLIMAALSGPLLGEWIGWRQWLAILIGFFGVLIIVQPSSNSFQPASILVGIAAFLYALMMILTRRLSRTVSNLSMVFFHSLVAALIGFVGSLFSWKTPDAEQWGLLLIIGVLATLGHLLIAQALRLASVGVIAPFEYTTLLWAAILGYLIWGDLPSTSLWIGAAVIVGAGMFIIMRESQSDY